MNKELEITTSLLYRWWRKGRRKAKGGKTGKKVERGKDSREEPVREEEEPKQKEEAEKILKRGRMH